MRLHPRPLAGRLGAILLALGLGGPAQATLGEQEASVARDARALAMSATRSESGVGGARAVHELRKGQTTVRQYARGDGTVYAVTWEGPVHPNLDTLLGSHAAAYRAAVAGKRRARGPRQIVAGNLVVEFGGHGRFLQGRAYLSDALPAGANVDDLQ